MTVKKPRSTKPRPGTSPAGDNFDMSGDFRGAVINIKSTIVGEQEARDIEKLPPEPGDPPFQGLQYFDEKDADRFFGREMLTARIAGRLHRARFLAIIGASGSGKSSLVRAGVIPALRRGERLADGGLPPANSGNWSILVITPTAHPLGSLAAALVHKEDPVSAMTALEGDLGADPRALIPAARRYLAQTSSPNLLLVVDQFEEVFTLCRSPEEREAFISSLLDATEPDDPQPITILLVMRADFYAQVAQHDRLREIVSQYQEFIGAMTRDELVSAIDKPLALGGWKIQAGLIEVILDDIGYEPGALPLLSHALHETWRRRRGRTLTLSAYTESGGIRGAIAQTAENVFRKQLSEAQQPIARMIFIRMAELGDDAHDTRRRATFSELITRSTDEMVINTVVNILTDARLVITDTIKPGDTQVFEVAHEALIREWPTLRGWLDEDRQGLILHQHLAEDTHDWIKAGQEKDLLYRGTRLAQSLDWAGTHADLMSLQESEFLEASRRLAKEEEEKARRLARAARNQRIFAGVTFVLIVALGYLVYSTFFVREPAVMDGFYNIAVAGFDNSQPGGDAPPGSGDVLKNAGDVVYQAVYDQLSVNPNILIWHDSPELDKLGVKIGAVSGTDPVTRAAQGEQIAKRLHADMLIYATLDESKAPPELQLEFYLAPQPDYNYEDLLGNFQLGDPVALMGGADADSQAELQRQAAGLAWIALGLTEAQLGHSLEALEAFLSAGKLNPQSPLVHFFTGREYLFLMDRESVLQVARDEFELEAQKAFDQALALDPGYSRAKIGLGGLYFKQAQRLLSQWMQDQTGGGVDAGVLDQAMALIDKSTSAYSGVLGSAEEPAASQIPLDSVARLGLGDTIRLKGQVTQFMGDTPRAMELFDQSIELINQTIQPLTGTGQFRYLAQAYEYLGEAYFRKGYVLEAGQDYKRALDNYQKSLGYYDQCIALADSSQDLIIRNELVRDICSPKRNEVQAIIDNFSGGQG